MNRYLYINPEDETLGAIIDEQDPIFPDTHITDRYTADFLSHCIVKTDEYVVEQEISTGMHYDAEHDMFYWPEPEPMPEPMPEPEPTDEISAEEALRIIIGEEVNNDDA